MMPVIGMIKRLRLGKRTRCNLEQRPQYPSKLNLVWREDVGAWRTHSSATLNVACDLMKLPSFAKAHHRHEREACFVIQVGFVGEV